MGRFYTNEKCIKIESYIQHEDETPGRRCSSNGKTNRPLKIGREPD